MFQEVRDVKSDDGSTRQSRRNGILGIVKYPGIGAAGYFAPASQAAVNAFWVGRIQVFDDPRQAAFMPVQRERAEQALFEIGLLAYCKSPARRNLHQKCKPALQEFNVFVCRWELERIKSCRLAIAERQVVPTERTYQDLEASVLVEDHLCRLYPLRHRDDESN